MGTSEHRSAAAVAGHKAVSRWLFVIAALIVVMAAIGGATRLTGSGLSITEWDVVKGVIPPLDARDWAVVFEKYKQIPQYQRVNTGMTLAEFKTIYWWEWGHRAFGRMLGFAFAVPLVWFWFSGALTGRRTLQLVGVLALGGLQAFVGWFMVQSGLVDRVSVSPVRLAMHLTLAVLVFASVLWLALSERAAATVRMRVPEPAAPVSPAAIILALVLLQIVLGAFVAGLKAGHTYNTWPLMDGRLIPNGLGTLSPWALNLVENVTTVQFNHRMVAYLLLAVVLWHARRVSAAGAQGDLRRSGLLLAGLVVAQTLLGIWTLLAVVPIALGLAHQLGAFAVIAAAVWHLHVAAAARP